MSSYPPGGDYDERLLDNAPKATKAERQEGYNVNLLASDSSDSPMNVRPPATVDGHASIEAGVPPTKEGYSPSYSVPWHRQKKWRIFMLIGAIVVIGAVVGGAVGGTLGSKNNTSKGPSHGPSTVSLPTSTGTSIVNAPAQSSAANGAPLPGSSPISVSTAGPGAIPSTVGSGVHTLRIDGVTGSG